MHVERLRTPPAPPSSFSTILRRDTNVVSLARPLEPWMKTRLEQFAKRVSFNHAVQLDTTAPDPSRLLSAIPDSPERAFLSADITRLAQEFGALLGRRHIQADLFVQREDGCRKIHVDHVSIRLLCTYSGPGTDWVPNDDLVRKHLGRTDVDVDAANRSILREGAEPRRCDPGDVLLLKGEAYPGNVGRGAAHRSPPLGTSGAARLVLKFDEHPCGC